MGILDGFNRMLTGLAPNDNAGGLIDPMEALRARQQASLMQGASLLQAGGPSPYPVSFGQALGGALQRGQVAQNASIDDALKRKLVASEIYARLQPPAAEMKLVPVMTPQGPRLVPERQAAGMQPYDASSAITPYQQAQLDAAQKLTPYQREELRLKQAEIDAKTADANKPLSPSDLEKLRDAKGQKFPLGTTQAQAMAAGATTTSQPEIDRKNAETTAKQSLDQLEGMALDSKQGGVLLGNPASVPMQSLNQAGQGLGHFLGTAASGQRQKYVDARTALASSLATAENPNDAVARESAVKRYLALIPDINTPEPEARDKFALLRSRLSGAAPNPGSSGTPRYAYNPATGKLEPQ